MEESKGKIHKLYPEGKYRTIVLDTINALQNNLYEEMMYGKKGSHDQWKDFGMEIYKLYSDIKKLPNTVLVQVLGLEGTGKTVGAKHLDPRTTQYLNTDAKPLSFFGANRMYTDSPNEIHIANGIPKNLRTPSTYIETMDMIEKIHSFRMGTLIVFVLGHIETYTLPEGGNGQRLKVLGKQATKLGIEGLNTNHTYYTKIDVQYGVKDPNRYKLVTHNSGFNTVRSPEGFWDGDILNNYQTIVDRILEDTGELEK